MTKGILEKGTQFGLQDLTPNDQGKLRACPRKEELVFISDGQHPQTRISQLSFASANCPLFDTEGGGLKFKPKLHYGKCEETGEPCTVWRHEVALSIGGVLCNTELELN